MIAELFALAFQAREPVVRSSEPTAATPWVEVISGSCGEQRLEVRRPLRPLAERPVALLNGARVAGAGTLEEELGQVGAAYRFSIQCGPGGDTMRLRWVSGLVGESGKVAYHVGSAEFRGGSLTEARSEDATEETFWYR